MKKITIEIPHKVYTEPEDLVRINNELDAKATKGELLPIRQTSEYLMVAEPAINGIWTLHLDEEGFIKKITLF